MEWAMVQLFIWIILGVTALGVSAIAFVMHWLDTH